MPTSPQTKPRSFWLLVKDRWGNWTGVGRVWTTVRDWLAEFPYSEVRGDAIYASGPRRSRKSAGTAERKRATADQVTVNQVVLPGTTPMHKRLG